MAFFLAGLGIILRGTAYALRAGTASRREAAGDRHRVRGRVVDHSVRARRGRGGDRRRAGPGRQRGRDAAGQLDGARRRSLIGVLAVVSSAYLAAVYLAADAARAGDDRALRRVPQPGAGAGVVAGAVALGGLAVAARRHPVALPRARARRRTGGAARVGAGRAWPRWRWSGAARYEPARYGAAVAVAAVIAGWALARYPTLLPGLTVDQAAASHDTLVALIVAVIAGGVLLFPSLGLLFALALAGRFDPDARRGDGAVLGQAGAAGAVTRRGRWRPRPALRC